MAARSTAFRPLSPAKEKKSVPGLNCPEDTTTRLAIVARAHHRDEAAPAPLDEPTGPISHSEQAPEIMAICSRSSRGFPFWGRTTIIPSSRHQRRSAAFDNRFRPAAPRRLAGHNTSAISVARLALNARL